jgi:hypothetical protein
MSTVTLEKHPKLRRGDQVTVGGVLHTVVKANNKISKLTLRRASRWENWKFQVKRFFGKLKWRVAMTLEGWRQ